MPYCSACGSKVEAGESFCENCGQQQVDVTPVGARRPPGGRSKAWLYILIPLMLVAVVVGVIFLRPAPVISVPGDFPTIQAAIDAAEDGDEIVVEPGTYRENIDFKGKAITLRSTAPDDPAVVAATIIDGGNNGSVVTFRTGETAESVLSGFTITGGNGTWAMFEVEYEGEKHEVEGYFGGGILVIGSSPTINNNTIIDNTAEGGGGIAVAHLSSATVTGNTFTGNRAELGGAIWVSHCSTLYLETPDDNVYRDNVPDDIYHLALGRPEPVVEELPAQPTTIIVCSTEAGEKTVRPLAEGISEFEILLPFYFPYDGFPQEMTLFFTAEYDEHPPHAQITWLTPDGREVRVGELAAVGAYRMSMDRDLTRRLGGRPAHIGLFADPAAEEFPLKGEYTLRVAGWLFAENDDLDARLVVYGRVDDPSR